MAHIRILHKLKKRQNLLLILFLLFLSIIAAVYLAWRPK